MKDEHSSSLQGNSELVLALTWPKQLSCNPKWGTSAPTTHNEKIMAFHDSKPGNLANSTHNSSMERLGNITQSTNRGEASSQRGQREIQPMGWKSTMAQNEFEHHRQQNVRNTTVPK